jgi:predicted dehydrogenase
MQVKPEIVAVCDTNPSPTEWFTENFPGIKQSSTDYHTLLENPDIDAIYCAVPHNLHAQLYCDIINAKKHLLGEKPFGIDAADNAQIMQAIAANPEVLVRCSSEFVFFPAVQRIADLVQRGAFGRILEFEAGFWHSSDLDPNKPINWKRKVAINGEYGVMGDLGFHVVHLPARLGIEIQDVRAILSNIVTERPDSSGNLVPCETWDNAHLLCSATHNGQTLPMLLTTKRIAPSETNTWFVRIIGSQLSAEFSTKRPKTLRLLPYQSGQPQAWQELDLGYESAYKTITG